MRTDTPPQKALREPGPGVTRPEDIEFVADDDAGWRCADRLPEVLLAG